MQANKASSFRQGARDGALFIPVLAPFSMLFGVFAADVKLSLLETMGFSFGIFAGASQFASLSLIVDHAPVAIGILAGFALNLRFMLYSATLAPHFRGLSPWRRIWASYMMVDQNFVLSDNKFPEKPEWSAAQKYRYYAGIMVPILLPWHFFTWLGFVSGNLIPPEIDISYALPLAFIALILPAIKTRPHLLAALISISGALALHQVPYNLGLMVAALIAIIVAAEAERRLTK